MKINKDTLTIGGDPEVFLVNKDTKAAVSAIGLIKGSKSKPLMLPEVGDGFAIQTDCCSVEFNLPPVKFVNGPESFYNNVQKMFKYISENTPEELEISLATALEFSTKDLRHPQARLAGCSVDYNAWSLNSNEKPNFAATNIRCNGAHLHFGYENVNDMVSIELIKALDLTIGVTSVLLDPDTERRKLYGRAGCFRITNFGIEYRTPSPYYLESLELVEHIYKCIDRAVDLLNEGIKYSDIEQFEIQTCINISDVDMAKKLIEKYKLESLLPEGILVN